MTARTITSPCSPGDTLWVITGDQVRECTVENLHIVADKAGCEVHIGICFIAPAPFVAGRMKEYHDYALLGRRAPAYRSVYETEEEARQALAKEGPDI